MLDLHPQKRNLIRIIVLGGVLVLASYWHGLATHPDTGEALWGDVPEMIRPLYTVSMVLAAVGFFCFTGFILLRVKPESARVAGRFGFEAFPFLYLLILIPSALWMPLTFAVLERPSRYLWLAVRADLILVGAGSVGLFAALFTLRPVNREWSFGLAVLGLAFFTIHTAVLDAVVWPAYFPH